jgi:type IV secretory pathway VirB10-like protein
VLLHAALLHSVSRHPRQTETETSRIAMLWLNVAPPVRKPVASPVTPELPRKSSHQTAPAIAAPPPAPAVAVQEAAPVDPAAPAPVTVQQMMSIARRDLGKIDQQLRKENSQALSASGQTKEQRLSRGFEQAHELAPNKWYQAARIEDITPPGDDARKIYRITTALGTYCVRYPDKSRMPQTGAANLGAPLIGACPHMF